MLRVSLCLKPAADELIDQVNFFLIQIRWIEFELELRVTFMKIHFPGLPFFKKKKINTLTTSPGSAMLSEVTGYSK